MSSIIQAAGRCNREGKLGEKQGNVYIFLLKNAEYPGEEYGKEAEFTSEFIEEDPQKIHDLNLFHKYYQDVINLYINSQTIVTKNTKNRIFKRRLRCIA